jgi:C4-dicarboxylate-specific signal transduction histidine kinase
MARRDASLTDQLREAAALREKYLQLTKKYSGLIARAGLLRAAPAELVASASGRLASVAVALIEDGLLVHASSRWAQIVPRKLVSQIFDLVPRMQARGTVIHELRVHGRAGSSLVVRVELNGRMVLALASEEAETWSSDAPQARARLWRAERLRVLGQLAAAVAHDLSSTLRSVSYLLSSIETDPVVRARCGDALDSMARGLDDSSAVVGRLHQFARTGAQPLQPVRLQPVIDEAVRLVQMDAARDGAKVVIEVKLGALPLVQGAAGELVHVFLNLLRNALEAGGVGVAVRGVYESNRVRVTVTDRGLGIPAENMGRIFEPFFTTKGDKGTGLGLFIASTLLQRMGATIGAANRRGGGAIFSVELQQASAALEPPAAAPDAASPPAAPRRRSARRSARRS